MSAYPNGAVSLGWTGTGAPGYLVVKEARNLSEQVVAVPFTRDAVARWYPELAGYVDWERRAYSFPVCRGHLGALQPQLEALGWNVSYLAHALIFAGFSGNAFHRYLLWASEPEARELTWAETAEQAAEWDRRVRLARAVAMDAERAYLAVHESYADLQNALWEHWQEKARAARAARDEIPGGVSPLSDWWPVREHDYWPARMRDGWIGAVEINRREALVSPRDPSLAIIKGSLEAIRNRARELAARPPPAVDSGDWHDWGRARAQLLGVTGVIDL